MVSKIEHPIAAWVHGFVITLNVLLSQLRSALIGQSVAGSPDCKSAKRDSRLIAGKRGVGTQSFVRDNGYVTCVAVSVAGWESSRQCISQS